MQLLFESSEESPGVEGLSIIKGKVTRFDASSGCKIPQIGWNGLTTIKSCSVMENIATDDKVFILESLFPIVSFALQAYFVHSFCALPTEENLEWILSVTDYGHQKYISMVQKGNVMAAQFHPEKSGAVGLEMIRGFLATHGKLTSTSSTISSLSSLSTVPSTILARRVIACLDVRSNDVGDLVVTKGDQYDVREADSEHGR
jgi:glutamine amidotransferase/cyclase